MLNLLVSAHINGGAKSSSVMRFLLTLPKLHFIFTPWSQVHVILILEYFTSLLAIVTTELLQL